MEKRRRNMWLALTSSLAIFSFLITMLIWSGITPQDVTGSFYKVQYVNGSEIRMSEDVESLLNSRYAGDQKEFIYCLYGESYEGVAKPHYVIKEMKETTYESDAESLSYIPCRRSPDYLGTIHSHPQPASPRHVALCEMSKQDIFTFGSEKSLLTGIICGEGKMAFFEKDDLEQPIDYVVVS